MDIWAAHCAPFNQPGPFDNDKEMKQRIDEIHLEEMPWKAYSVKYTGEAPLLKTPTWMKKAYEVWYRDPRQIVHNILANEDFDGEFDYTPFREMKDGKREWSDFMSGNWAWNQAVNLSHLSFPQTSLIYFSRTKSQKMTAPMVPCSFPSSWEAIKRQFQLLVVRRSSTRSISPSEMFIIMFAKVTGMPLY
jgi:hypothetical protein